MTAQHQPFTITRPLAALAVALSLGFAFLGAPAKPAAADSSQWVRQQPHWWDKSNGWKRHNSGNCFNCGPRIIVGGSGVVFSGPGLIVVNPGFVVNQPGFIVQQGGFIVRQPNNFVRQPPAFARKQWAFFKRHPSLWVGQPWKHRSWKHNSWKHKPWKHNSMGGMN
jgi:hypothetical protein